MSNVVSLRRAEPCSSVPVHNELIDLFANRRRGRRDAYWLKENAELLQVLLASRGSMTEELDLSPYAGFIASMVEDLQFFPQYYRLFLSMALDLAALGMPQVPVAEIAKFIVDQDLTEIELSDSHRAEARLLLSRAGHVLPGDEGLALRLAAFARKSALFCLPNRQLAYALTHTVFHASDYGRKVMSPCADRRLALMNVGIVAWFEDNLDLLSEVVVALRLSGEHVPDVWRQAIAQAVQSLTAETGPELGPFDDAYHEYLVLNWAHAMSGGSVFAAPMASGARYFRRTKGADAALRDLSICLLNMGDGRSQDWARMRWRIWPKLSIPVRARIEAIETLPEFTQFFNGFARVAQVNT